MASALATLFPANRRPVSPAEAMGMMVTDTTIGGFASYGLAQLYARKQDKWYGKKAFWIAGGAGKVLEGLLTVFAGPGWATGVVGAIGQAGVNGVAMDLAFDQVRKEQGVALVKVPAGTNVRNLKRGDAVPASTAVGALPQADAGRGLAWDHIQELASMH